MINLDTKEGFGMTDFVNPISLTKCGGPKLWKTIKKTFKKIWDLVKNIWDIIKNIFDLVKTIVETPIHFLTCLWDK
tara:strand:- start:588 stop:815 length:228 start_codon:yes stop_codon:yes gene_type:complete